MSESKRVTAGSASTGAEARARILAVDDTIPNLEFLQSLFEMERLPYELRVAGSGALALEYLEDYTPDLILLDVAMPVLDGFAVCEKIKARKATRHTPVIFLSGRRDTNDIVRGFAVGAADYVTKPFQSAELIARMRTHIELKRSRERLAGVLRAIRQDLSVARGIQETILPGRLDSIRSLRIAARYEPVADIGGDFYDAAEIRPGVVRCFLADATGHGIQAALIAMAIKSEYESLKLMIDSPAQLLSLLLDSFCEKFHSIKMLFTCFIVDVHVREGRVVYGGAGHPGQILIRGGTGVIEKLERTGIMIGVQRDAVYEEHELPFASGDRLFLFSDGVFEQMNAAGRLYGLPRMMQVFESSVRSAVEKVLDAQLTGLDQYLDGETRQDDVTLIGIECP
ncbi:MAG: fused response regulator/phosphatase [bacterium]|nr:fused response regulator/phosphatase [bacterium]